MKTIWILEDKMLASVMDGDLVALFKASARNSGANVVKTVASVDKFVDSYMFNDPIIVLNPWDGRVLELAYYRHKYEAKYKIVGFTQVTGHYAIGDGPAWSTDAERAAARAMDTILVQSMVHAEVIYPLLPEAEWEKVKVVGGLLDEDSVSKAKKISWAARRQRVFFPYEGAPADQPQVYDQLQIEYKKAYPNDVVEWAKLGTTRGGVTQYHVTSREEMMEEYGRSRVVFSSTMSCTWPREMLEARMSGAQVLAPAVAAFAEILDPEFLYADLEGAVVKLHSMLNSEERPAKYGAIDRTRLRAVVENL